MAVEIVGQLVPWLLIFLAAYYVGGLDERRFSRRQAKKLFDGSRCAATSEPRLHPRVYEAPAAGRPAPRTSGRPAPFDGDAA